MNYYILSYIGKPIGESGESCKSEYDFSKACDICGTGAELIGNLKVKGFSNINKDFFGTLDDDLIISKRLYEKIKKFKKDFELLNVIDTKYKELDYFHLVSKNILVPFSKKSTGYVIEDQCPVCKRNGYFSHAIIGDLEKNIPTIVIPYNFIYKRKDFSILNNPIIGKTWECIGLSNKIAKGNVIIRYARPWIIVHEVIKETFEKESIKMAGFLPLIIE